MTELPRPAAPGEPGPTVLPMGGSQAKSKGLSPQVNVNKNAMERYQRMLKEKMKRRSHQG